MDRRPDHLVAIILVAVVAPAIAWLGVRSGQNVKANTGLAAMLLGFSEPIDPPTKHLIEATEGEEEDRETSSEPLNESDCR